jgi:cell division protein ZapA (FtsZ GTPase activity inhibitor)
MGNSFQITIMGQTYHLKGTHDKEYVARVENFLNEQIEQVRSTGATADTFNLMVLVALNLADDCLKKEEKLKTLFESIQADSERLIKLIDSRL